MCTHVSRESFDHSKKTGIDTGYSEIESKKKENVVNPPETVKKEEKQTETVDISSIEKKAAEGKTLFLRESEEAMQENMPPVYLVGQDILDSRKALGDDDNDLVEDSEEMKDVKNKIMMIQAYLNNPMPPFAMTPKDESSYKKELDAVNLAISMMYNKLVASMDAWLGKGKGLSDYTKERFELIEKLKNQVLEEESLFAQSMVDYRQSMIGSNLAKTGKSQTWADMLRFQRALKIDLDELEKQPEEVGAGTSEVLKIKRDGKTLYFKPEDATYSGTIEEMITDTAVEHFQNVMTRQEVNAFKDAVTEELDNYEEDDFYDHFYNLFVKDDLYSKLKKDSEIPLEAFLANVPKKRRKIVGDCFKLVFKTYNQLVMSSVSAKITPGSNLTRRNVATSRLASIMGIGDMFAESRTAVIKKNGQIISGNLMEDAGGLNINEALSKSLKYSKEAEDQLLILPVFDLLCGQVDRHWGNFMYIKGASGEIKGIKCIDNDMAFGNLNYATAMEIRTQLRKPSRESLHALPPKFKKALLAMDGTFFRLMLRDLLNPDELDNLEDRLKKLQDALIDAENYYINDKNPEVHDHEMIKLSYFTSLRKGMSTTKIDDITLFQEQMLPGSSKIASRTKERRKQLAKNN
ncbi:MAG: hypothetical protein K5985_08380 [Lachnospiraceae bacterium]|nr:hypothetical protein [Lachnospiraceae bacterium]